MKKILIALDYNPSARKIAEIGHDLAKAMNARTILMHVVSDPIYYSSFDYSPIMGFGGFSAVIETDSYDRLVNMAEDYLDKSKEHLNDKTIETIVRTGDYGESILKAAAESKVDLIVMGTHSRRGLEKILVGSVAEKVLHNSLIPLVIIPTRGFE